MKPTQETVKPEPANRHGVDQPEAAAAEPYEAPEIVVHDSDEFIRSLGPAQACSPTPISDF